MGLRTVEEASERVLYENVVYLKCDANIDADGNLIPIRDCTGTYLVDKSKTLKAELREYSHWTAAKQV